MLLDFSSKNVEVIHAEVAVLVEKGLTYIEALIEYAENNDIEVETLGEIIKRSSLLKELVRNEAVKIRLLPPDESDTVYDICQRLCD